jgi:hypothetical protein
MAKTKPELNATRFCPLSALVFSQDAKARVAALRDFTPSHFKDFRLATPRAIPK